VALAGAVMYGLGVFLASFTNGRLWWLYLTYGVIGGVGLGLGYIVPVAVLVKWFPDRRGLITGIAVGGFGAGALITAPLATRLIAASGVLNTFAILGLASLVIALAAGSMMRNPPEGWRPDGWTARPAEITQRTIRDYALNEALRTPRWWALWLILFLNISAGIALISQESPIFQEVGSLGAVAAAGMVGIASLGNALGRVLWAWLSDSLTRRLTFATMFVVQAALFWMLPSVSSPLALTAIAFAILTCYGGGFGTMPATVADSFGPKNVGPIYGLMLTAWGLASAFGPLVIAWMREATGAYDTPLRALGLLMLASAPLPLAVLRERSRAYGLTTSSSV
jgi:OFA family oxalate/formate antiporter-like MFS transporter